VPVPRLRLTH